MQYKKMAKYHQTRIAKIAISVSAFRRQGESGLIEKGRDFCKSIDLHEFAAALKNSRYRDYLDEQTRLLQAQLKPLGGEWGTARKGLNIFFRDVFYTQYFYREFGLKESYKSQLEVPLDSKTGLGIREKLNEEDLNHRVRLPRWKTVKGLTPELSDRFQLAAQILAKHFDPKFDAIDLDLWFWASDGE